MNLLAIAIFEADAIFEEDASTIKASVKHWLYKKEQTQLSELHYRGLELPPFPEFSGLLASSQSFPLRDLAWKTSHWETLEKQGGMWDICALLSLRRAPASTNSPTVSLNSVLPENSHCLYSPDMKKQNKNPGTQTNPQRSLSLLSKIEGK